MSEQRFQESLNKQLVMTRETWRRLRAHGILDGQRMRLDFTYVAPSHSSAADLLAFLKSETDYDVKVVGHDDEWTVVGATRPVPMTLEIVEQWVAWMMTAGASLGCVFDGWGTELP